MLEERCARRQLWTAVFIALLVPASALPALLAGGGSVSWLAPVAVFPLALGVLWSLRRLGDAGLAAFWRDRGALGKLALTLYYIWALSLSALTAGSCVDRLGRTDYREMPAWLLALALAAVTAYLVWKGRSAFFRAVQIFYLALLVVLILFFALGAANLRGENLRPRGWGEARGVFAGILPTACTLSVGTLAAFFPRQSRQTGADPGWRWLLGWCLVAAGLCALVLGALGPELAGEAPLPFFLTLQGLGFSGGFQRLEALGTAAWVLSDLTLLGLAALAGREMAGGRRWALVPPLVCALLGGCFLSHGAVQKVVGWIFGADLALGALVPVVCSLLPAKDKGLSCG